MRLRLTRPAQASPGATVTLWVKVKDPRTASALQYEEFEDVDTQSTTLSRFKARVVEQAALGVRAAQVTLSLVAVGEHAPPVHAERAATELADPSLTLAEAGVSSTAWLMAAVASTASLGAGPSPGARAAPCTSR